MPQPLTVLKQRLREYSQLNSISALLQWDQEVSLPPKGMEERARTLGYLSTLAHEKLLAINTGGILEKLRRNEKNLSGKTTGLLRESWRTYQLGKKLPTPFVRKMTETCSHAQRVWAEARKNDDFELFLPHLKKIISLKRQEAVYLGYESSPYDALIDTYEPGMTTHELDPIFDQLRVVLPKLLEQIQKKQGEISLKKIQGSFPLEEQKTFNVFLAEKIGFDFRAGRMDISTHPFTTNLHPQDVRFTTRYDEHHLLYSLGSTMHEVGHALYEQGMRPEYFGTPLSEAVSLGIHESQSRIWENMIGKSLAFWTFFYPKLQKQFPYPFKSISLQEFYRIMNNVTPSFIRTEADEVTYNLHILLRYEIERDLIEGTIKVEELPNIWNKRMKQYLGINVPNDRLGVLQDVHWSGGLFGYFPTYTLGNLYAAQLYAAAEREMPTIERDLKHGQLHVLREWLRKKIHIHGKHYPAKILIQRATGETLTSEFFFNYLEKKYQE